MLLFQDNDVGLDALALVKILCTASAHLYNASCCEHSHMQVCECAVEQHTHACLVFGISRNHPEWTEEAGPSLSGLGKADRSCAAESYSLGTMPHSRLRQAEFGRISRRMRSLCDTLL